MGPPDPQKGEGPGEVVLPRAFGVDALPDRLSRYGEAKRRAIDVADYVAEVGPRALSRRVAQCGEYLLFRHYWTVDEVRLHAARLCCKHLLCPLCAIRRGVKAMQRYLDRFEAIQASRPDLRAWLVTLTVKDGADLAERFEHLHAAQRELWKRKQRGRGCAVDCIEGAVWSYEAKRGANSGLWHPHLHMVALAPQKPDAGRLAAEWHDITGDSFIVDVRAIEQADPASGFCEVFKYAVKFSSMELPDTWEAHRTLSGRRLIGSAGLFRGVDVPDGDLLDAPLDDLPYVDMLYRYFRARGPHAAGYRPVEICAERLAKAGSPHGSA